MDPRQLYVIKIFKADIWTYIATCLCMQVVPRAFMLRQENVPSDIQVMKLSYAAIPEESA